MGHSERMSSFLRIATTAVVCGAVTAGCASYDGGARPRVPHRPVTARVSRQTPANQPRAAVLRPPAITVLHDWDRRRARAWATGDVRALADLYAPGSRAGRADVALLRSYLQRGLLVRGLRMQVFAVKVLRHRHRRWRLLVTDRLQRAVAFGAGTAVPLPRDRASTRVVSLVRADDGRWRVAAVRALDR